MSSSPTALTKPLATIDLGTIVANYRLIVSRLDGASAAAMVKANGYGLGAGPVTDALLDAGCRKFFVAGIGEALSLRRTAPGATIHVLEGPLPATVGDFVAHDLIPVLNSLEQLAMWRRAAAAADRLLPAVLHIDTGMSRLGLPPDEYRVVVADQRQLLAGIDVHYVMSHLASADIADHPQSEQQLKQFVAIRDELPMGRASLANSAGIFLGPDYHFDLVRPGISLFGGSPHPDSDRPNPMDQVLTVEAPIIQIRHAEPGETVGYGATHLVTEPARIATIPVGYADGFLRSSSSAGFADVAGHRVPIVGRVSMDLITLDVSAVESAQLYPGAPVELLGRRCPVDEVASRAGSIPHEFLTNLSGRFETRYLPAS